MGFSNLWHFIHEQSFKRSDMDWTNIDVKKKPWIVIDWNNFVMNIASSVGGHIALMERRIQLIVNALASSGARICIISDRSFHSVERSGIKLIRMHSGMSHYVDVDGEHIYEPSETVKSVSLIFELAFHMAKIAFRTAFPVVSSNVEDAHDDLTMYIDIKAEGEADGAIRSFIRNMPGKNVLLLSKDGSLLLGVPNNRLYVIDMNTIALQRCARIQGGYMMTAKICHMRKVLQCLDEESNKIVGDGIAHHLHDVDEAMLVWIAALLGGETSYERRDQQDNPIPLLYYLTSFLLTREDQEKIKKPILSLLVATVAIRAWFTSTSSATNVTDISSFIKEIQHNADTLLQVIQVDLQHKNKNKSKAPVLFGMICPLPRQKLSPPVTYLHTPASNLLNNNKPGIGGLANPVVRQAIAVELNSRRNADLDLPPVSPTALQSGSATPSKTFHVVWGKWTWMEGIAEDTELLLSPLLSLVKQLRTASKFARINALETLSAATEATEEATLSIAATEEGPMLVDDLNHYVRSTFLANDGGSEPTEDVSVALALTIRTRKIRIHPGSSRLYRAAELLQMAPQAFPADGVVVGDDSDSFGLGFHTCHDALEGGGVYCTTGSDHLYSTSKPRPLLNLKNRAMVIDRVIREGGILPRVAPVEVTAVDRVTSSMMRVLGLAASTPTSDTLPSISAKDEDLNRMVDRACADIGAFWAMLPGSETARTHLLTTDPSTGPARIIIATLYAFTSLLKDSVTIRLQRHFESVLSAITTALLLCPCFALTSANDPNNRYIPVCVDPFTGNQTRVDLLAALKDFEEKMTAAAKSFIVDGSTRVVNRLGHLTEGILHSIKDLLKITTKGTDVDWVCLYRWFNLCGMQFILGHWEVEGSIETCYTRVCEVNVTMEGSVNDAEHTLRCQALSSVVANTVEVITALTN